MKFALIVTALVIFAGLLIPELAWLSHGFMMLTTLVHEASHALMAIITGGHVSGFQLNPDGSGHVLSTGFIPLVASAGYLGTSFIGYALIRLASISSTGSLYSLLTLLVFATGFALFSGAAYAVGWLAVIMIPLFLLAYYGPDLSSRTLSVIIGFQLALNAVMDIKVLFGYDGYSDAVLMRQATGIPATIWAALWLALSLFVCWKALTFSFKELTHDKANRH